MNGAGFFAKAGVVVSSLLLLGVCSSPSDRNGLLSGGTVTNLFNGTAIPSGELTHTHPLSGGFARSSNASSLFVASPRPNHTNPPSPMPRGVVGVSENDTPQALAKKWNTLKTSEGKGKFLKDIIRIFLVDIPQQAVIKTNGLPCYATENKQGIIAAIEARSTRIRAILQRLEGVTQQDLESAITAVLKDNGTLKTLEKEYNIDYADSDTAFMNYFRGIIANLMNYLLPHGNDALSHGNDARHCVETMISLELLEHGMCNTLAALFKLGFR